MPLRTVQLGPWAGIDNVHTANHAVFQPSTQTRGEATTCLLGANNVDIDDSGWPTARDASVLIDSIDQLLAECQAQNAKSMDHSARMESVLEVMQEQGVRTTKVLEELAEAIRAGRESSERKHADLMDAVSANTRLATWAVERANSAAGSADAASRASGESAGRVTTLTKATIAGWVTAVGAAGALVVHITTSYGWPWLKAIVSKLQ